MKRIQRKRTKSWKMPPNTIYVGRPGKFGNPFLTAAEYDKWLSGNSPFVGRSGGENSPLSVKRRWILKHIQDLLGHDLACWCPLDQSCHADVLLKLTNEVKKCMPGAILYLVMGGRSIRGCG